MAQMVPDYRGTTVHVVLVHPQRRPVSRADLAAGPSSGHGPRKARLFCVLNLLIAKLISSDC